VYPCDVYVFNVHIFSYFRQCISLLKMNSLKPYTFLLFIEKQENLSNRLQCMLACHVLVVIASNCSSIILKNCSLLSSLTFEFCILVGKLLLEHLSLASWISLWCFFELALFVYVHFEVQLTFETIIKFYM
jgi:hypothetical protein